MPYDTAQYGQEKADGTRLANGARPLTKLTGKHLRIINLHMTGMKGYEIAQTMNMTQSRVSLILNDPLVKGEIEKRFVETDREMMVTATQVVRDKMEATDPAIALRAAEMVWRSHGKFEKKMADRPTAEDVVAKMLEIAGKTGQASISVTAGPPPPSFDGALVLEDSSK